MDCKYDVVDTSVSIYRNRDKTQHESYTTWIKDNIKMKECSRFNANETIRKTDDQNHVQENVTNNNDQLSSKATCTCGMQKSKHTNEMLKDEPTDAFGEIKYRGLGDKIKSKYVRVAADTSAETLYKLLSEQWKLHHPNLLISVVGGARNFYLKTHMAEHFCRGLSKVAQSTDAWIFSGGCNKGVEKLVGKAVQDYTLRVKSNEKPLVSVGIVPWSVLANRHQLINAEGSFPARYKQCKDTKENLICLDFNHSHFLLVDDGTCGVYGTETEFRLNLEKRIQRIHSGTFSDTLTPVICVVVDGGNGTLNLLHRSIMENDTPCVIFKGSGRLADVIASCLQKSDINHDINNDLMEALLDKFFGEKYKKDKNNTDEWVEKIKEIVTKRDMLTVFSTDENSDLEVAILKSFMKVSKRNGEQDKRNLDMLLRLAMAWNRVDIADKYLFTDENQDKLKGNLHEYMNSALIDNKPDFVRLLLDSGVTMEEFLENSDTLLRLYNNMLEKSDPCILRSLLESSPTTLHEIYDKLHYLLGSFTQRLSCPDKHIEMTVKKTKRDPWMKLFLWAILLNKRDLAMLAWEQCKDCIAAALAASKILKNLAQEGGDYEKETESMRALAVDFEKQAIDVFDVCYHEDKKRAQKLLTRISNTWGETTCLRLAVETNNLSFIAHPGVQTGFKEIWSNQLAVDNPPWKILLCILFFPLVYTNFLAFREPDRKPDREPGKECGKKKGNELPFWKKVEALYSCPKVKCFWNTISYIAFLWLFAVVLMMDFQCWPSWKELLLYGWFASLVCEEVRQFFDDPFKIGFLRKSKMYITDIWNIVDVLFILVFITGVFCRLHLEYLYLGKVILCLGFVISCLRLMFIFKMSKTLGPKIIIIKEMMKDMFVFMFMLSIWIVAYGVAKQSILINNENRLDWIIRAVIYEPYLTLLGEIPTNVDYTQFNKTSCSVNGTDPLKPKCPVLNDDDTPIFPEWLAIIMMCVYLLFANILLLNLLIAIFNYSFEKVQENTDIIWNCQLYDLLYEYYRRPVLPPPFCILSYIFDLFRRMTCKKFCKHKDQVKLCGWKLKKQEEEELLSWEFSRKSFFLESTWMNKIQSVEYCAQVTAERVRTMSEVLSEMQKQIEECNSAIHKLKANSGDFNGFQSSMPCSPTGDPGSP